MTISELNRAFRSAHKKLTDAMYSKASGYAGYMARRDRIVAAIDELRSVAGMVPYDLIHEVEPEANEIPDLWPERFPT